MRLHSMGVIERLMLRYPIVLIEDRYRIVAEYVCKSCKRRVECNDKFCRECGIAAPVAILAPDPDRRFIVTVSSQGLCYPPKYAGPSLREALDRARDSELGDRVVLS